MATPEDPSRSVQMTVTADGSPLPGTWQVTKVSIDKEVNKIPQCEMEVIADACCTEECPVLNSAQFAPGTKIEVKAGYDDGEQSLIYSGIVMKQNVNQQGKDNMTIRVICKDPAVAMTQKRYSWNFDANSTDQDVMQKSITKWKGVSAKVASTKGTIPQPVKFNATDWDFVLDRAEVNGMVVIVEAGTVNVHPPSEKEGSTVKLEYGDDVFEFDAELSAENQFQKIEATAWDVKSQKVVTASYTPEDYGTGNLSTSTLSEVLGIDYYQLQAGGFLTQQELETWVNGVGVNTEFRKVQGSLEVQGSSDLVVGGQLNLNGFGSRFDGNVYLSGLVHTIEDGNWMTKCTIGLKGIDTESVGKTSGGGSNTGGTSGQLPAVQGLQVGKVKKINEDPDGNFRVQVEIPIMDSSTKLIWARFNTFYASKGVGALFYPETDDEVVVGYFGNDPRYPVVLGSLYSSSIAPPDSPDEQNNLKEIVTREKMKMSFDEEKKIITITTPGENKMIFSDEGKSITIQDQNGNKIVLGESGISIESPKQVSIKGTQKVSAQGMEVTLTGDQKLAGSAPQVSMSADMQLECKSSAQASFQGGAICEVKGAMVKIN